MLVLTRKLNEEIVIGEGITIKVLRIRNNRVQIGITAPEDVHVVRGELPRYSASEAPEEEASEKPQPVDRVTATPAAKRHRRGVVARTPGLRPLIDRIRPRTIANAEDRSPATPAPIMLALTAK